MREALSGMKVTVMGLGLNGGGLESARFFARHGAEVTVTDLRKEEVLRPSLDQLAGFSIRYVLERHELDDFKQADLVIKNPAVRPDSVYLQAAKDVETDISIFLSLCRSPLFAVTGSKGKSSASSALHHGLLRLYPGAKLGGNITTSPLSFLDDLKETDPVVLELSSWQLGDLKGRGCLKPRIALITNIYPDHLDRYPDMESYVNDKRLIYADQGKQDFTVSDFDSDYGRSFASETSGTPVFFSSARLPHGTRGAFLDKEVGWYRGPGAGEPELIIPENLGVVGPHMRKNLLAAGLCLRLFGMESRVILEAMGSFPGIEHRLELCGEKNGVRYYNDSAATIPEALVAAVESFSDPLHLITGGTDKNLDFSVFAKRAKKPKEIYLLQGSATVKIRALLDSLGREYKGPYDSLEEALREAAVHAKPGEAVVLSPGCTSFGMFLNEFDRGKRYKAIVRLLG